MEGEPADWIRSIVIVAFHAEHGQVVESVHPPDSLPPSSLKPLSLLSLPDTTPNHSTDISYSYRHRINHHIKLSKVDVSEESFLYCGVFFRQSKKEGYKRAFEQRSVVVVGDKPYLPFYLDCVRIIGPLFFEYGSAVLDSVVSNIKEWPTSIVPGETHLFELAGSSVEFTVPNIQDSTNQCEVSSPRPSSTPPIHSTHSTTQSTTTASTATQQAPSTTPPTAANLTSVFQKDNSAEQNSTLYDSVALYSTFGGLSVALWHIWELALLGEPIIVLSNTPRHCSQAVLAIHSVISPVVFNGDYRPYFTMYSEDYTSIKQRHDEFRGNLMGCVVLGVTNPYFLQALEYWPNIICLGVQDDTGQQDTPTSYFPTVAKRSTSLKALLLNDATRLNGTILTRDEPKIAPDVNVLCRLKVHHTTEQSRREAREAACVGKQWEPESVVENNLLLRNHFKHLTMSFLRPLERYFKLSSVGSRAARQNDTGLQLTAYSHPTLNSTFNIDHFMQALEVEHNTIKQLTPQWRELYRGFLNGPHFLPWLKKKKTELELKLSFIYRHLRLSTNSEELIQTVVLDRDALGSGRDRSNGNGARLPRRKEAQELLQRVTEALDREYEKPVEQRDVQLIAKMIEHLEGLSLLVKS